MLPILCETGDQTEWTRLMEKNICIYTHTRRRKKKNNHIDGVKKISIFRIEHELR